MAHVMNVEAHVVQPSDEQAKHAPFLVADQVHKVYKKGRGKEPLTVVDGASMEVGAREFVALIGPSGCGKSTLLSCLAGLTDFDEGNITLGGRSVRGPSVESAMVFQHASLLPWRSVEANISYSLELRRTHSKAEIRDKVTQVVALVGLGGFENHFPHEISGGMQQRVNLARALVVEPSLLLMDEPFGALDALTKEQLQDELSSLVGEIDRATVFVTHDIREAVYLADRVLVMSPRPGHVIHEARIDFPRTRTREMTETPEFEAIVADLRKLLRKEPHT